MTTQIKPNFLKELQNANSSKKSSLPFIKHTLSTRSIVKNGEIFQTLVIGGSFYQNALMKKDGDKIRIVKHEHGAQPPFIKKPDLMKFLEKKIDKNVKIVAVNFAYPLKPKNRGEILDGVLVSGSKENTFKGLIQEMVGEEIEKYIFKKRGQKIKVSVANDTMCLLLSGLTKEGWDKIAAGIVGTGLNFAIFLDKNTAVNLESANFDKFKTTYAGKIIDKTSVAPGDALYEKHVSGAYLFQHFNIEAEKRGLYFKPLKNTKELENYLNSENKDLQKLAREILDYSAKLVAAQIAAILEFSKRDLTFVMQGSLYWKGAGYREMVEETVEKLSPNYKASYLDVYHSDVYGAAKLVA